MNKKRKMTIEEATQILITTKNGTAKWPKRTIEKARRVANEYEKTLGKCHKPETMGKHYKRKSKKRLSEKQKRALAKGRKVLSYLRTGRQVSEPKEPLLIKEGYLMSKAKRKMSKKQKAALARGRKKAAAKRSHGFEGFEGGKKRHKKRPTVSHVVKMQGDPGSVAVDTVIDLSGLLAGAIGLSLIASIVPVKKPLFRPLIAMAAGILGLFIPAVRENRFGNRASLGSLAIGSYSLTKQLVPKMPLMGAGDTAEGIGAAIENLPPEEKAILGILPETPQPQIDYDGGTEQIGSEPGEMLGSEPGEMLGSEPGEMLGTTETIGAREDSDFE